MHTKVNELLGSTELKAAIQAQGAEPQALSAKQFAHRLKTDYAKWKSIVQASGAKIE